ncbi:UDP-GlcNAc:undecaprenyl-phosphate GlcNAc-1-phosphate transferase [Hoyosella altamirensis]|uniref:UDP-GlcNAc:undecaprenyl-phosphate GlcNAc-1-phosphate transferase n=2 Tax=Hoyosella altamirensis TaxID=616997 RepID=A0A839RJ10_9ACTN|nr:UDP-GlcNAc:undecaprenyl-phosphate GlcNAc-1-phosphate transferase [Hoyosella altamirensis]
MSATDPVIDILAQPGGGAGVPIRELMLICLTAAIVTFLGTGLIRVLATRGGAVAYPRDRDVHVAPTPRMGGVGMFLGIVAAMYLAQQLPALTRGFEYTTDIQAAVIAGAVIVVVGMIDDRWGLDALTKFMGQVTAGGVLVIFGVSWYVLYLPFGDGTTVILDQLQAAGLTVFLTVLMVNAMNFVDGLDGLAAGLGLIAALAICAFSVGMLFDQGGDVSVYPPAMLAAALAGACLGFLPHNFQPARIFMGDSGSMLIGLMLAAVSTSASGKISLDLYGPRDLLGLLAPILVVVAVMFIPLLDLLLAVIRRTRAGRSPFSPDKMHLHHRLLEIGHSHRRVVLVIYGWVALLAFGAVGGALIDRRIVLPVFIAGAVLALVITMVPRFSRSGRRF